MESKQRKLLSVILAISTKVGIFLSDQDEKPSFKFTEPPPKAPAQTLRKPVEEEKIDIDALPEMSVEDVDAFLAEEDPEFLKTVEAIGTDRSLSLEQIIIDDASAAYHAEVDLWNSYQGPRKVLFKVFPFAPRVSLKLKQWKYLATAWMQGQWIRVKNFGYFLLTEGRRSAVASIAKYRKSWTDSLKESMAHFKKLRWQTKLLFLCALSLVVGTGFVINLAIHGRLFPQSESLFLTGWEDHATASYKYDPNRDEDIEPYINNARMAQNLYLTPRLFVNLARPKDSPENPMGAFEFFIEGMSSDVILELKDREHLLRDLLLSTIQGMTFEELDTEAGKKELCTRILKAANSFLVSGKVKNVRIKTIVIKP